MFAFVAYFYPIMPVNEFATIAAITYHKVHVFVKSYKLERLKARSRYILVAVIWAYSLCFVIGFELNEAIAYFESGYLILSLYSLYPTLASGSLLLPPF